MRERLSDAKPDPERPGKLRIDLQPPIRHGGRPMTLGEIVEAEGGQGFDAIIKRLDAIEASIEMSHADREEFAKNDLPYLDLVVQRAAKECIVPTALQTDIKGRFFRAGMATMLAWLQDHPEELRGRASRLDDLGRVVPASDEEE